MRIVLALLLSVLALSIWFYLSINFINSYTGKNGIVSPLLLEQSFPVEHFHILFQNFSILFILLPNHPVSKVFKEINVTIPLIFVSFRLTPNIYYKGSLTQASMQISVHSLGECFIIHHLAQC